MHIAQHLKQTGGNIVLITGGQVRRICKIGGKEVNWRTYKNWVPLLTIVQTLPNGTPLFDENEVREFARTLPKTHPPTRTAILPIKPWTPWGKRKTKSEKALKPPSRAG